MIIKLLSSVTAPSLLKKGGSGVNIDSEVMRKEIQ